MGKIVPFTGEFNTRQMKAEKLCEELICNIVKTLELEHEFNTDSKEFLINIAWLIKFLRVVIDDEIGLANKLSRELKSIN